MDSRFDAVTKTPTVTGSYMSAALANVSTQMHYNVHGMLINATMHNCSTSCNGSSGANTTHHQQPLSNSKGSYHFQNIILFLLVMILVVGSVGNSVVCYVFGFKQRKRRSVPETLFLYLGTVDLIASIVNPSLYIYWTVTEFKRWDFGIVGCKFLAPLAPISVTLSALLILIIAVDRYFIIVHQFGRNYSQRRIKFVALGALLVSICLYIPYIYYLDIDVYPCMIIDTSSPGFAYPTVAVLLLQDCGFICILIFTNVKVRRSLRQQKLSKFEHAFEARRTRSNTRLTRILIAMSLVFCLLVIPRDILQSIFIISWLNPPGVNYTPTIIQMNSLFKVMQTANSCVNVFIYSKMHRKFRGHLIRMICGIFVRKSSNNAGLDSSYQYSPSNNQAIAKWKMRLLKLRDQDETPTTSPLPTRSFNSKQTSSGDFPNPHSSGNATTPFLGNAFNENRSPTNRPRHLTTSNIQ
eukprot:gene11116-12286_t